MKRHTAQTVLFGTIFLVACGGASATSSPGAAPPQAGEGSTKLTKSELDARLKDGRLHSVPFERMEDGPMVGSSTTPSAVESGGILTADACTPGGVSPQLVTDAQKRIFVWFAPDPPVNPPSDTQGAHPPMMPPTLCAGQRMKLPAGATFGGVLNVSESTARPPSS